MQSLELGIWAISLGILGLFCGMMIYAFIISVRETNEKMAEFAKRAGLNFQPGTWTKQPPLTGTYQGVEIEIYTEVRKQGKYSTTYLIHVAQLPVNLAPVGLVMVQEGLLSKVSKVLGREDIQTGYTYIDDAFIIRGADPGAVKEFIAPPHVRKTLLDLVRTDASLRLEHDALRIECVSNFIKIGLVRSRLEMLVKAVKQLEAAPPHVAQELFPDIPSDTPDSALPDDPWAVRPPHDPHELPKNHW
jgi:hypothetical protein